MNRYTCDLPILIFVLFLGERVVLKDNNLVYDPGTFQGSLIINSHGIVGTNKHVKQEKQGKNNSKKASFGECEVFVTVN